MTMRGAIIAVATGLLLGIASAAYGQDNVCAPREVLAKELAKDFGERPVGLGLSTRGSVLELFKSVDGQTWTLVSTRPTGVSCIMDAGEKWTIEVEPEGAPL